MWNPNRKQHRLFNDSRTGDLVASPANHWTERRPLQIGMMMGRTIYGRERRPVEIRVMMERANRGRRQRQV